MRKYLLVGVILIFGLLSGCRTDSTTHLATRYLQGYFRMASRFFEDNHQNEPKFKLEYINGYRHLLTGKLLEEHIKYIRSTSLDSGDFPSFFSEEAKNRVENVVLTEQGSDKMIGYAMVKDEYEYDLLEEQPDLSAFVQENHLEGWTQKQFNSMLKQYNPSGIRTSRDKRYNFVLVKKPWGWRFSDLNVVVLKTHLKGILNAQGWEKAVQPQ